MPTAAELERQYDNASNMGLRNACKEAEAKYDLPAGLMLAIASRETDMRNIVGDGGHGRGVFQIDDRYHQGFLRKHGTPPPVPEAAMYAASLIAGNLKSAKAQGVPEKDRLRVALAGYNAGMGGAMTGYRKGTIDSETTGLNYSSDVLARRKTLLTFMPSGSSNGGGKDKDKDKGSSNGGGNGTGGAQAPSGKKGSGQVPSSGGEKIVLNPDAMRRVAAFLDRTASELHSQQQHLNALRKPEMPTHVRIQVLADLAGVGVRMRALWPSANEWGNDLKRRADRVDQPAGSTRKPSKASIKRQPLLQRGATGAKVKLLQRLLNKLGFGPLVVDGIFGPLTMAAVQRYQRKRGLGADGVVGQRTWSALLGRPATRPGTPPPPSAPSPPPPSGSFRSNLAEVARSQRNIRADDASNRYRKWANHPPEPWCADFVSWAYSQAGKPIGPGGKGYAWCPDWINKYFKPNGMWHPGGNATPKVGAVVLMDWGGDGEADHIGIVTKIQDGVTYYTSGNTTGPGGEGVFEKSVQTKFVMGYGY